MVDSSQSTDTTQGSTAEPRPDPWSPPEANYAQAASIAAGIGAIALDQSTSGTDDLSMLMNPAQLFHVVGASLDASDARTWVLVLMILSVVLNIFSLFLRYQYAGALKEKWVRWEDSLRRREQGAPVRAESGKGLISRG